MNYYNDFDANAAQWLKNLIVAGLLPPGVVDSRPIQEVTPHDLAGFTQCHFFAGIGGWSLALAIAGWRTDEPVWTGSCPCQPFSVAGKGAGTDDPRHLWPEFRRLIADFKPPKVFGEQVASKDGRGWLARVRADLEAMGYGVGAADLCAAGVGAPHIRQRLWWVADSAQGGFGEHGWPQGCIGHLDERSTCSRLGHALQPGSPARQLETLESTGRWEERGTTEQSSGASAWSNYLWIPCADGKARRIEPGLAPLVDGLPGRVGLVRGYGNAISPQVAAEFIAAYMECAPEHSI